MSNQQPVQHLNQDDFGSFIIANNFFGKDNQLLRGGPSML